MEPIVGRYDIWDLPVRAFHWYLVLAVLVMWWSGEQGRMEIHQWTGCSILCAVLTRIIWGFIGSEGARFASFVVGPKKVFRYVREGGNSVGHNPLGGLSIVAFFLLLLLQAISGLFSRDDLLFDGPLSYWAGDASGVITEWHEINWELLRVLIVLHLLAVAWHQFWKKQPLIQAMWWGRAGSKAANTPPKPIVWAIGSFIFSASILAILLYFAPEIPSYY